MNHFVPLAKDLQGALKLFSFDALRSGQKEPIESVLSGENCLLVMPTGAGKSLCFQIPSCLSTGITVVVSPLIALMKDQVDALRSHQIPAIYINSSLTRAEQDERIGQMQSGIARIVYVAPERFRSRFFMEALKRTQVDLLAVDEAHCISEWGHDFRPDYRRLKEVREALGSPVTIALTATATPDVQKDIIEALELEDPAIHVLGFERKNLFFDVVQTRGKKEKLNRILALVKHLPEASMVIYCATRKQCEEVFSELKKAKLSVGLYHGGLSDRERDTQQVDWTTGKRHVLVATNAFGMGVDKGNVRAVIHYNIPGSLEAYYQEAGRAGRDGKPAYCVLLFSFADKGIHEFFATNSYPSRKSFQKVWDHLRNLGRGTHLIDSKLLLREVKSDGLHAMGLNSILRSLQFEGAIEHLNHGGNESISVYRTDEHLDIKWSQIQARRKGADRQLKDVVRYASATHCRQHFIVSYFGAVPGFGRECENCDSCSGLPEYVQNAMSENIRVVSIRADDPETIIRKCLAGIARARGRRGATAVAGMLVGSKAKAVKDAKLHLLSTFGVLKHMRREDVVYTIDICTNFAWASRDEYGCVRISERGSFVMKSSHEMTEEETRFVEATFIRSNSRNKQRQKGSSDSSAGTSDTYKQTLILHQQGLATSEVAKERGLTLQTVLRHLQKLAFEGEKIDVDSEIDGQLLIHVRRVAEDWSLGDREKPLIEAIKVKCTYNALRLHLIPIMAERRSNGN